MKTLPHNQSQSDFSDSSASFKKSQTKLTTEEALKAMGEQFDLDPKTVRFFIRQMQLSGKI